MCAAPRPCPHCAAFLLGMNVHHTRTHSPRSDSLNLLLPQAQATAHGNVSSDRPTFSASHECTWNSFRRVALDVRAQRCASSLAVKLLRRLAERAACPRPFADIDVIFAPCDPSWLGIPVPACSRAAQHVRAGCPRRPASHIMPCGVNPSKCCVAQRIFALRFRCPLARTVAPCMRCGVFRLGNAGINARRTRTFRIAQA